MDRLPGVDLHPRHHFPGLRHDIAGVNHLPLPRNRVLAAVEDHLPERTTLEKPPGSAESPAGYRWTGIH